MRLSEASELFLSTKKSEGFSSYTTDCYSIQYRLLIRDVGDIDVEEVDLQTLRDHVAKESEHLKPSSVRVKIRSFKSFFSWLHDEEYINRNPTKKLREPKEGERIPKALNVEEVELLRDSCKTTREHALIEFFFATGCRVGEVHRLNRSDVNFENHSARVLGKGNKPRDVYFGARASIWLKRYLEQRTDDEPALFVNAYRPYRRMNIHQIQWVFDQIASRCGLGDKVTPHVMRHTFCTTLLDNGAPLHMAQSIMGHDKPETTLLYTKLSGAARKQAYDRYFMQ